MDRDRIKGKVKDTGGRIERQVGEWTGDEETQARGTARQAEGKVQKGVGRIKEAVKPKRKKAA